ncbi:mitochondrial import inner membrane translocase [Ordospora colligata]|uniref:Mitochondrial import inner membrane translocase n=1 Tax=Ordospora colligata OC4 TaxID=1354746 RepID=A0A0B2UJT2_9MICR|nr:mitochondrial import inner membrane translocase [Ordospora colligata OC4]KHN69282.1 mitochondrial import inner membrane translocase [Ordospora colligata OC4]TBU15098.1 mitochondrial import inner membrane translocase [Ordospora colligata]TBU15149.1 mitochondrial import inner membrane translocase [Ordospora colligata]TBU18395.1 mitochondrial import inner membrane translocase [Ordospora colligata]
MNVNLKCIREKLNKIKPYAIKTVSDTLQGYAFGCMVGAFSPEQPPTLSNIHRSGKSFARISLVYSSTESVLHVCGFKESAFNSFISGAVAGGMGPSNNTKESAVFRASALATYAGVFSILNPGLQK